MHATDVPQLRPRARHGSLRDLGGGPSAPHQVPNIQYTQYSTHSTVHLAPTYRAIPFSTQISPASEILRARVILLAQFEIAFCKTIPEKTDTGGSRYPGCSSDCPRASTSSSPSGTAAQRTHSVHGVSVWLILRKENDISGTDTVGVAIPLSSTDISQ